MISTLDISSPPASGEPHVLELDRALAASELRRALAEGLLHRRAVDHDHEVLVADALEREAGELVEVLHGQVETRLLRALHEGLEGRLLARVDRLLARERLRPVALRRPDPRREHAAGGIEDRRAQLRPAPDELRR